jgi:hypothetical protein
VADLALGLEVGQRPDLVGEGDLGVDAVELEQVDPVEAQVAEAQLDLLAEVPVAPDRPPVTGAGAPP